MSRTTIRLSSCFTRNISELLFSQRQRMAIKIWTLICVLRNDGIQLNRLTQTSTSHVEVARRDLALQSGSLHPIYIPAENVRSQQGRIYSAKQFPLALLPSSHSPTPKWLKWLLHTHLSFHSLLYLFKWPNDESWLWLARGLTSRGSLHFHQCSKQVLADLPFSLPTPCLQERGGDPVIIQGLLVASKFN